MNFDIAAEHKILVDSAIHTKITIIVDKFYLNIWITNKFTQRIVMRIRAKKLSFCSLLWKHLFSSRFGLKIILVASRSTFFDDPNGKLKQESVPLLAKRLHKNSIIQSGETNAKKCIGFINQWHTYMSHMSILEHWFGILWIQGREKNCFIFSPKSWTLLVQTTGRNLSIMITYRVKPRTYENIWDTERKSSIDLILFSRSTNANGINHEEGVAEWEL